MLKDFNCIVCSQVVDKTSSHSACSKTCGNSKCQAIYHKQNIKKIDQLRQHKRIEELKKQGFDMVSCAVCSKQFEMIGYSHLKIHNLTVQEYNKIYPDFPRINSRMKQQRAKEAIKKSSYLSYQGKKPDQQLYEFLTGCLLGDGSLEKSQNKSNARYAEGGNNQKYLEWKYNFLSQYFPCSFNERLSSPHTKTGKRYKGWWIKTTVHPLLTQLHHEWYQKNKILPQDFITNYLTEFALIVWFCDDGCSSNSIIFYTMAFNDNEVAFLADLLNERFGLTGSILKNKNNQPFIKLNAKSKRKFREITSNFIFSGMEYKLNF
jgi:ribosomal protein S18